MEEKYRDIMEELLYLIGEDIYSLLNEDYEDIEDAIITLSRRINKLSDDVWGKDEIIYKRSAGRPNFEFSLA